MKASRYILWGSVALTLASVAHSTPISSLLKQNRLDEAVGVCRQYEVLSSFKRDDMADCAWVYMRTDRLEAAEKILDKLRVNPNSLDYQLLTAYANIKKKRFELARISLTDLSAKYRTGASGMAVQLVKAEMFEAKGTVAGAGFIYKGIVSENPTNAWAQWGLARYYLGNNDLVRARKHLMETAKFWPKHLGSRYNLGRMELAAGNLQAAGKWLTASYRINRSDVGVLEQLGILFEKKGRIDQAIKYWQRAVNLDNKNAKIAEEKLARYVTQVADKLIEAKQYDEALNQLSLAKGLADSPEVALRRGIIFRYQNKFNDALKEFLKYAAKKQPSAEVLQHLGVCYLNINSLDEAENAFMKASNLKPEDGMNFAWLGFIMEAKNDITRANLYWQQAVAKIEDRKELSRAKRRLASVQTKLKEKQE